MSNMSELFLEVGMEEIPFYPLHTPSRGSKDKAD